MVYMIGFFGFLKAVDFSLDNESLENLHMKFIVIYLFTAIYPWHVIKLSDNPIFSFF